MNLRWKTWVGGAVITLVLLMVLAFGGVHADWYLPVDGALIVLALAVLWLPGNRLRWLDAAVMVALALPCAQLAFGITVDRAATETWLLHWVAAACVYLIARRTVHLKTTARILAAFGGLLGLEAIAQQFVSPQKVYGLFSYPYALPMGPFINRDDFAACMGLLLPFALFLAVRQRSRRRHSQDWRGLWWALAAAVMIGAELISASRGGTLVIILELVAFVAWQFRPSAKASALAMAGVVAVLLAGMYAAGVGTVVSRFQNLSLGTNARLDFNRSGLSMGAARPVLGWGVGTWGDVYPQFARVDTGQHLVYAHNDWVQMFAEAGLAGLAAVGLLGLALVQIARAALRHHPSMAAAAIIALGGLCLNSTLEFVFHIPALLLLFALIAGSLTAASELESTRRRRSTAAVASA